MRAIRPLPLLPAILGAARRPHPFPARRTPLSVALCCAGLLLALPADSAPATDAGQGTTGPRPPLRLEYIPFTEPHTLLVAVDRDGRLRCYRFHSLQLVLAGTGERTLSPAEGDGLPELQLKFDRNLVQDLLRPGSPQVTLEGSVSGEAFTVEWAPHFVNTGKTVR